MPVTRTPTNSSAVFTKPPAHSTGAVAVDMETAAIARVAAQLGVPYLSLRVVLDSAEEALPEIPPPGGLPRLLKAASKPAALLSLAVIDNLDDAIAVFAHDGSVSITNQAYRTLWGTDPDSHVIASGVVEATRVWHGRSTPTPIWGDFRDFVENPEERAEWSGAAQLIDGRALNCRFVPLSDGGTQVIFSVSENHIGNPNELLAAV